MYWLMDAFSPKKCYKPTHPTIKSETWKTLNIKSLSPDKRKLIIDVTQLDRLKHDLPSRDMEVRLSKGASGCQAKASLKLGLQKNNKMIYIQELYAKGKYIMNIPQRAIEQLTFNGYDVEKNKIQAVFLPK